MGTGIDLSDLVFPDFRPLHAALAINGEFDRAILARAGLVRGLTEIGLEFRGTPPWPHWDADCRSVTEVRQR